MENFKRLYILMHQTDLISKKMRIIFMYLFLFFSVVMHSHNIEVPRLSPLPADKENDILDLNGKWLFNHDMNAESFKKGITDKWKEINVPAEWVMQGFNVKSGESAIYFRKFTLPDSWKGKRIKLRCNAIYSESKIFINRNEVGKHLGGFTAFEFDITKFVRWHSDNEIAVMVKSESLADSLSSASDYAVHQLGGITRNIFLFSLPEVNVSMFHVNTIFDSDYNDATLCAEVNITNEDSIANGNYKLLFDLYDKNGERIELQDNVKNIRVACYDNTQSHKFNFTVKSPDKWDSEHPNLYKLTCKLIENDKVIQVSVRKFGFRQIEIRGNKMYVNNHPIKLHGVCYHEVMPLNGRSVNDEVNRKDVELFLKGNVNYIRTSHYPPNEALLEACDELGMFVEVEAPFCWAHKTKVPDSERTDALLNQHLSMLNLYRSHPSVLMWSLGNESKLYKEYFKETASAIKKVDPTRPRIFSQWRPDGDNGDLEVANHHYPGPEGPRKYNNYERPVVFDEFCHINAYNRLELASDPGLRNMWGVLLDRMWNAMYYSKGVLGGAIWAGIDDTFFLPEGDVVGYGTWGVIDGWRRHKPEFWGMKKAFSPVKIRLKSNQSVEGKLSFEVENRYFFSNLNETKIEWRVGDKSGVISPDIPAGEKGEFDIILPDEIISMGYIDLKVNGVHGFEVDAYHFRTLPEIINKEKSAKRKHVYLGENNDEYKVTVGVNSYILNKKNGLLSSKIDDTDVLIKAPELMILPLNPDGKGKQMKGKEQVFEPYTPVCSNWIAETVEINKKMDGIYAHITGKYNEAEGAFTYIFKNTGEIELIYDFRLLSEISPRQIGIVFSVPSSFNRVRWRRKGYWSVYPQNHIGMLEGEAIACNSSLPMSGLAGSSEKPSVSWSFDQAPAGSNLFRATKENIYETSFFDDLNREIKVISDGQQHLRAWKIKECISFLVADYNNAGSDIFLKSHSSKDYCVLRIGDKITGKAVLVISK